MLTAGVNICFWVDTERNREQRFHSQMKKYRCPTCAHPSLFPPSIRAEYESGASFPQIASHYHATPQGVKAALVKFGARLREPQMGRKPKTNRNDAIRADFAAGVPRDELARIHAVTPTRISAICKKFPSQQPEHKRLANNRNKKRK